MKASKLFLLVIALVLLASMPAWGQATYQARTVVAIPFDFVAGNATLPPGEYTITVVNAQTLKLTGENGTALIMVGETVASGSVPETKLVFTQQDGHYVLHQVWTEGQPHVHDVVHGSEVQQPKTPQ